MASHPLWHSVYIGLGYTSNHYGIHYADRYGAAAAHELDPNAVYLSRAYESALRKQAEALAEHDPSFVLRAELEKAVVELYLTAPYTLLLALLLPAAVSAVGAAHLYRYELALILIAVAIGALPAILAVPFRDYALSLLGPLGTLGLLSIGSAAARVEDAWLGDGDAAGLPGRARRALVRLSSAWPRRQTMRTMLLAVTVLVLATAFARHLEGAHERWDRSESAHPQVVLATASEYSRPRRT
jgi:hypothetical protein